jgi:hypothetical protein
MLLVIHAFKIPIFKKQISNKFQYPKFKNPNVERLFGYCLLIFGAYLYFGNCYLSFPFSFPYKR